MIHRGDPQVEQPKEEEVEVEVVPQINSLYCVATDQKEDWKPVYTQFQTTFFLLVHTSLEG